MNTSNKTVAALLGNLALVVVPMACGGAEPLPAETGAPPPAAGAGMVKVAIGADMIECSARASREGAGLRIECAGDRVATLALAFPDGAASFDCGRHASLALSVLLDPKDRVRTALDSATPGSTCGVVVHTASSTIEGAFWANFSQPGAGSGPVPLAGSFAVSRPAGP